MISSFLDIPFLILFCCVAWNFLCYFCQCNHYLNIGESPSKRMNAWPIFSDSKCSKWLILWIVFCTISKNWPYLIVGCKFLDQITYKSMSAEKFSAQLRKDFKIFWCLVSGFFGTLLHIWLPFENRASENLCKKSSIYLWLLLLNSGFSKRWLSSGCSTIVGHVVDSILSLLAWFKHTFLYELSWKIFFQFFILSHERYFAVVSFPLSVDNSWKWISQLLILMSFYFTFRFTNHPTPILQILCIWIVRNCEMIVWLFHMGFQK